MTNNTFYVYIYNEKTKKYEELSDGGAVFPFLYSELLDEQLDEAEVTIVLSKKELYEPLTRIKIEMCENGEIAKSLEYVVSNPTSYEMPIGSKTYKVKLSLIEPTKLLEGIYCQSLTFRNPKGNIYSKIVGDPLPAFIEVLNPNPSGFQERIEAVINNIYTSPISIGGAFGVRSVKNISDIIKQGLSTSTEDYGLLDSSKLIVNVDGVITNYGYNDTPIVKPLTNLQITYDTILTVGIVGGNILNYTLKFTYTFELSNISKYPPKPYTVTDCINRVLELAEPLFKGEPPRYVLDGVTYQDGEIVLPYASGSQAEKYDKIIAPEFTMTQCTLREQLKIIGGYIHAEPRLTGKNTIIFDELGLFKQVMGITEDTPYIENKISQTINEYCTRVDTSASNIINTLNPEQGTIVQPNSSDWQGVRTDTANVRVDEGNGYVPTSFPIQAIRKVECGIFNETNGSFEPSTDSNGKKHDAVKFTDITPYVFEQTAYNSNLSSYQGSYPYAKCYAIYYTQGEEGLKGLFFKTENATDPVFSKGSLANILSAETGKNADDIATLMSQHIGDIAFRISYIPIYDTRFTHSKQFYDPSKPQFTKVYNQSENLIETRYYGENIKGAVYRMGNPEKQRTYYLNSVADVPKIGEMIGDYAISAVHVEFGTTYTKCTVDLTKDFNRISQYIGVNSQKRIYQVSEREAYIRNALISNYIVVGKKIEDEQGNSIKAKNPVVYGNAITKLLQLFDNNITSNMPLTCAISKSHNKTINADGSGGNAILPVISSSFGNTMVFSWEYRDNYSAGRKLDYDNGAFWQADVAYGDYFGRAYFHEFRLTDTIDYSGATDNRKRMQNLPQYAVGEGTYSTYIGVPETKTDGVKPYRLRKDSAEALKMNIAVEFVTNREDLIIGSGLAKNCPLVTYDKPTVRVAFLNTQVNKFQQTIARKDILYSSTITDDGENYISVGENYISFSVPNNVDFLAWAIITDISSTEETFEDDAGNVVTQTITSGGDIILACNKSYTDYAQLPHIENIYFSVAR